MTLAYLEARHTEVGEEASTCSNDGELKLRIAAMHGEAKQQTHWR
ncbi:MAG TPA: hypothetical protein VGD21_07255 [Lysobacter sp.]